LCKWDNNKIIPVVKKTQFGKNHLKEEFV